MVAESLFSSKSVDWNTPPEIIARIISLCDGNPIGLDPCSNESSIVPASTKFDGANLDGLVEPWDLYGLVYVNPPYGKKIGKWCAKALAEAKKGAEIVMLVPARTCTAWWHNTVPYTDAFCFLRGRLTFLGGEHPAPFPSALLYWGEYSERFAEIFDHDGWVVLL